MLVGNLILGCLPGASSTPWASSACWSIRKFSAVPQLQCEINLGGAMRTLERCCVVFFGISRLGRGETHVKSLSHLQSFLQWQSVNYLSDNSMQMGWHASDWLMQRWAVREINAQCKHLLCEAALVVLLNQTCTGATFPCFEHLCSSKTYTLCFLKLSLRLRWIRHGLVDGCTRRVDGWIKNDNRCMFMLRSD